MLNCWIRPALFCFSSNCLTWITAGGSDNNARRKKRNNVLWQQLCFAFSIWTIHNSLASFPCVQWQTGPAGWNQLRSYCFLGGKHTQTPKHTHPHTYPKWTKACTHTAYFPTNAHLFIIHVAAFPEGNMAGGQRIWETCSRPEKRNGHKNWQSSRFIPVKWWQ